MLTFLIVFIFTHFFVNDLFIKNHTLPIMKTCVATNHLSIKQTTYKNTETHRTLEYYIGKGILLQYWFLNSMVAALHFICAYQKKTTYQDTSASHKHLWKWRSVRVYQRIKCTSVASVRCDQTMAFCSSLRELFFYHTCVWEPASECFISHLVYEYTPLWGLYGLHHLAVQERSFRCVLCRWALCFAHGERWLGRNPCVQWLCREGRGVVCLIVWWRRPVWKAGWLGSVSQGRGSRLQKRG